MYSIFGAIKMYKIDSGNVVPNVVVYLWISLRSQKNQLFKRRNMQLKKNSD